MLKLLPNINSYILLPAFLFLLAVLLRADIRKAWKGSVQLSIALIGISILFTFFMEKAAPIVSGIAQLTGKKTVVTDVGWPQIAMLVWSVGITYFIIPISFVVNLFMLYFKQTQTINVDIWNFWHTSIAGFIVYAMTENILLTFIAYIIFVIINLKLADWTRPCIREYYEIPDNFSVSTVNSLTFFPIAIWVHRLIEIIPGIKKIGCSPKRIEGTGQKMIGTGTISLAVGFFLALLGGQSIIAAWDFALCMTAVFEILPRIITFMKAGFLPVADAAEAFARKRFGDSREIHIGVNHMILSDENSVVMTSILLLPPAILMSVFLPFIEIIPMSDLTNLVCLIVVIVAVCRGNVFRAWLVGLPTVFLCLLGCSYMAPLYEKMAIAINMDIHVNGGFAASMNGNNYLSILVAEIVMGNPRVLLLLPVLALSVYSCLKYYRSFEK